MNPGTSRKKNRKQKAVDSAIQGSILAMAGIVVHIIGAFYRMSLNDAIGKQENRYYTSALSVYNILLMLSSYGMPVAVSKMVSARLTRGEHRNYSRILKAALIYAMAVGGIVAVVLWLGTDLFAEPIKMPLSRCASKILAPTIWIMAYLGMPREYFQGTDTMVSTTVSQILKQIVNTVVSVVAAGVLFGVGTSIDAAQRARDYFYVLGTVGSTIGTGAGALTVLLLFICLTASKGRERRQLVREDVSEKTKSYRRIFYVLTIAVLPIVISNGTYNYPGVVDSYPFGQGMDKLGYLEDPTVTCWGALGQYQSLPNIPVAVSDTLSSSLIPSLTGTVADRNRREKLGRIATFIRFSLLIAIPAAVGIAVLAKPVCSLLFISEDNTTLIWLSMASSLTVVFYFLLTVISAIFQGLNHMDVPVHYAVTTLVIRVAMLEVFLTIFKMEIYSAAPANVIFVLVMCLLNGRATAGFARYRQEYRRTPILSTIYTRLMGAATYGVYRGIYVLLPYRLMRGRIGMATAVSLFVAVATLVYAALLVRFRAVEGEELKSMPGGRRLVRLLNRFRLLG